MARTSKRIKTATETMADKQKTAGGVAGMDARTVCESGAEIFIPLNRLKKSPRNARKMPHSEAIIEAYAASIASKGMFQNLVVEPELDEEGSLTGFYFVTIGEGRRQAQLLRAKRKEIGKAELIRCVIDTANDPNEISLDENVTREAMHPADQFEAFRRLHEERGWGAEEIAARFGVSAQVVRQRLRLGAVSPKLMQIYREEGLTLDQLMAFALTEDHARQEQVYENLSYNREPYVIRRELTRTNVPATDRRAIFVGAATYNEAGGAIIRDLFTEDRGGFYEDAALLDQLVIQKLHNIARQVQEAEGWNWADVHIDFPHAHGLRRTYSKPVDLCEQDETAFSAAKVEFDRLTGDWDSAEELPDDVDQRFGELEAEIERIDTLRHAYDADDIVRGGVFVVLSHDGEARIERGFIRSEDEQPEPDEAEDDETVIASVRVGENGEVIGEGISPDPDGGEEDEEDDGKQLSDLLVRDLTAHRTLGLRLALGEQPDIALIAVTHRLATQIFYLGADASPLEIRPNSSPLSGHAEGIEDTAAGKALMDRHAGWAADMPGDVGDLWGFVAALDSASLMALFAHCASLTVNAVKLPWERRPRAHETADRLAAALALDMTAQWAPNVGSYFGRVTKAHILAVVCEAVGNESADRIAGLKKQPMAEAAEQLLAGTTWLPVLLRTPEPVADTGMQGRDEQGEEGDVPQTVNPVSPDPDQPAPVETAIASDDGAPLQVAAE